MKVWLVNPYGPIPGEEWREYRFAMIARALHQRGHDVTWWTAAFDHFTKRMRATDWQTIPIAPGFQVVLVPTPGYRRNVGAGRLRFEVVFALRLLLRLRGQPKPDLVIAADPPQIAGGFVATVVGRRSGTPVILDCLDLWPELFAGILPKPVRRALAPVVFAPLRMLRRFTYSRAAGAVASSETYRDHLLREVSRLRPQNTEVVYIGVRTADLEFTGNKEPGLFTAVYSGTLGQNYDLDTLLDAARLLSSDPRFRLLIAGDGPRRDHVSGRISREQLTNVTYAGRLPAAELPKLYASAAVGLIPYAGWSTVSMPVKVFDYLAAGLPVVTSLAGELRRLIEECDIGATYRAGDAASLAGALRLLMAGRERRDELAANARVCAKRFERDEQYSRFAEFAERLAGGRAAHESR